MEKKAMAMPTLKTLVLFLAVTIIVLTFIFAIFIPSMQDITDKEVCKLSVFAEFVESESYGLVDLADLSCYTNTLTVKDEGIYKVGKDRKPLKIADFPSYENTGGKSKVDINYERQELVKEAIANEMYDCWDQFGRGELPLHSLGDGCLICSEIDFDIDTWMNVEGVSNQAEREMANYIFNFGDYLNTKVIGKGNKTTYSDFFGGDFESGFMISTRINTKIVFKGLSQTWLDKWVDIAVFGCAFSAGGIIGAGIAEAYSDTSAPIAKGAAIAGSFIPIPGSSCLVGFVAGAVTAAAEGSDWTPGLAVGPSRMVSEDCSRLY